jgi:hypothetical protein
MKIRTHIKAGPSCGGSLAASSELALQGSKEDGCGRCSTSRDSFRQHAVKGGPKRGVHGECEASWENC